METKPAFKTTEFWVHNYVQLMLLLNTTGAWHYVPKTWSTAGMAVVAFGYAIARGIAKSGVKPDA